MGKIEERIGAIEAKLKQLQVQRQRQAVRAGALAGRRSRQGELRRKILVGAIVLAKVQNREFDGEILRGWLDAALVREDDRALFDLPPRP